jgi:uncharacterized sulfatase
MKRTFIQKDLIVIVLCLCCFIPSCTDQAENPPNILLAISDDQSYFHAGPYGLAPVRTPVLDQLAEEGIMFTNAFSASPMCTVGRAALLTGRNPWQNGEAGQHWSHFPDGLASYTDHLEEAGYMVGYTGKGWGPGNWQITGYPRSPAGHVYNTERVKEKPASGMSDVDYSANFRSFLKQKPEDQPFCFWYGASEPHSPYEAGSGLKAGYNPEKLKLPPNYVDTSMQVKNDVLDYFLEIEYFDTHLGRIIEILKETGEYENTIIVVTSDNGTPMPGAKANLYDLGTHVPLVILWPGKTGKGLVVDDLVSQIDLAPTFLEAAGLTASGDITGRSIMDLMLAGKSGKLDPSREYVLAAQEKSGHVRHDHLGYPMRSIRTDEYLYIRNFKPERWPASDIGAEERAHKDPRYAKRPPEELYRVQTDFACMENLADQPDYEAVKKELRNKLEKELRMQSEPRMLGFGDMYESFPRYGRFRDELEGFKNQGEYNPDYLMEIPDEILVSSLYHKALQSKLEDKE